MFENEGTEIESTESDVSSEPSSEAQDSSQAAPQAAAPKEETLPFHEHPRWKEVMEERNSERQRAQALEQRLADMDRRYQELSKPKSDKPDFKEVSSKMQERLKGIDPEFQAYMQMLEQQAMSATDKLTAFEEKQLVTSLTSKFEDLAAKNSLSPALKDLYFAKMDAEYRAGRLNSMDALEKTFKAIHEPYSRQQEELKRAAIEEYTKAKKADANKPTGQPKGKAPVAGKVDFSKMTAQEQKQFMNKQIVTQLRAGRET